MKLLAQTPAWVLVLLATTFEVAGYALLRKAIHGHSGHVRAGLLLVGTGLLLAYGCTLNLAPVDFGRVAGLYVAVLFVVWQIGNLVAFCSLPSLPVCVGGALVVAGGLIMTYWDPGGSR